MPERCNRICNIEDWQDVPFTSLIRQMLPYLASAHENFPAGHEQRKHWEYAHIIRGFEELGVLRPDAWLLSVAGGHEEPAFWFTNFVRWMFVTDLYGATGWADIEAHDNVLVDPDHFARFPYNRNRLVVQYMNALDLRYPDGLFDGIFCLSSIEHFGGLQGARSALAGMRRVLKPGGILAMTTECVVNDAGDLDLPGLYLFTPKTLTALASSVEGLELVSKPDFSVSAATRATRYDLRQAVENAKNGHSHTPHIVLELDGREFTSVALFFRRTG